MWCWLPVTEVSYFALRSITPRVFPFFVTEDDCITDANVLPVLLFTFYDDSSSSIRICPFLAECSRIPRPRGRHVVTELQPEKLEQGREPNEHE